MQNQHVDLGMSRPHWGDQNIKIPKYIKLRKTKLQCCDAKLCDRLFNWYTN